MTTASIHIQEIENRHKPALPIDYIESTEIRKATVQDVVILGKGTNGGQATIAFCAKFEDGSSVILETTANIFHSIHGAFIGAEQRFAMKTAKKN